MKNGPEIRFILVVDSVETEVFPRYDTAGGNINTSKDSGNVFFSVATNGKFTLLDTEFDLVNDADFDTEFEFRIEAYNGSIWEVQSAGYFAKTDCDFDEDESRVTFQPLEKSVYTDFLAGLDREFNLIDIAPEITPLTIKRQPIFQIYLPGQSFVTNFLGGGYWEQPVTAAVEDIGDLQSLYFFGIAADVIFIPGGGDLDPDVGGQYDATLNRLDGVYRIEIEDLSPSFRWNIYRNSDDAKVYEGGLNEDFEETVFNSETTADQCRVGRQFVMMRYLTELEDVGGTPTEERPENDIVGENTNYTRVLPIISHTAFTPFGGTQAEPTKYGKVDETALHYAGEYFQKYVPVSGQAYPINRSGWFDYSLWFYYTPYLLGLQEDAGTDVVIRDCYKLVDVIRALLAQIAPDLTHEETADYSDYLYGSSNAIRGAERVTMICPKSNLTKGDYDKPAARAQIKMNDVIGFLWSALRAKWYIAPDGKFVIEHVHYFENGLSYAAPVVGYDATTINEPMTGLNWAYGQNKWRFAKGNIPDRIEFSWMDESSPAFNGVPIEILAKTAEKGNIESNTIGRFTSDVDFMLANAPDIAQDGFAAFEAVDVGGGSLALPFVEFTVEDADYSLQNGYLSFVWLHENIHLYNLPTATATVNGREVAAASVRRSRLQDIKLPFGVSFNPMQLVTTGLGTGAFSSIETNIDTGTVKATIEHDSEP